MLDVGSPRCDEAIFDLVCQFGICYGMQLMAHMLHGKVEIPDEREYGIQVEVEVKDEGQLLLD